MTQFEEFNKSQQPPGSDVRAAQALNDMEKSSLSELNLLEEKLKVSTLDEHEQERLLKLRRHFGKNPNSTIH